MEYMWPFVSAVLNLVHFHGGSFSFFDLVTQLMGLVS